VNAQVTTMRSAPFAKYRVLGVDVTDLTFDDALALLGELMADRRGRAHVVYFVNAHTLNVAARDPRFREVLNTGDYVFGDGTGVRWATRMIHRHRLLGNVNGTDLTPALFETFAGRGLRYYLLGALPEVIERAAAHAREHFHGWTLAGHHHGYLDGAQSLAVVERINAARPDLLLVGMGSPNQETWLAEHRERLQVPLCMATGGLFTYWSGDLVRASTWMRRIGFEWLHLLIRQPHKSRRYLLGNPAFLLRSTLEMLRGTRG
jgi:N-acetylglucosaminyldiphosphoundecaprenol N-acetyl-beta-D-mannosaminyltransferase